LDGRIVTLVFFYVRNHGVPDALLSGTFRCAEAFFTAPQAEMEALAITRLRHNRRYVGVATESLNLAQAECPPGCSAAEKPPKYSSILAADYLT